MTVCCSVSWHGAQLLLKTYTQITAHPETHDQGLWWREGQGEPGQAEREQAQKAREGDLALQENPHMLNTQNSDRYTVSIIRNGYVIDGMTWPANTEREVHLLRDFYRKLPRTDLAGTTMSVHTHRDGEYYKDMYVRTPNGGLYHDPFWSSSSTTWPGWVETNDLWAITDPDTGEGFRRLRSEIKAKEAKMAEAAEAVKRALEKLAELGPAREIAAFFEREGFTGQSADALKCPLTKYLSLDGLKIVVGPESVSVFGHGGEVARLPLPGNVRTFIRLFDVGVFPRLMTKGPR